MKLRFKLQLIGLLTSWSPMSLAITSVPCHTSNLTKNSSQIIDVAYFGAKDPRMNLKEFAKSQGLSEKEVIKQFSGVGTIRCGDESEFSAQLVGNSKTVVTAAHGFFDANCNKYDLDTCAFTPAFGNAEPIKFDASKSFFKSCVPDHLPPDTESDWAVLELKKPLNGATPFKLPNVGRTMRKGDEILQVTGGAIDFKGVNFGPCRVLGTNRRVINSNVRIPAATDCAAAPGASGSGQFIKNDSGEWEILGVVTSIAKKAKNGDTADLRSGLYNRSTIVYGELWEELNRRANEPN